MTKEAVFTMKLEYELREAFLAEAAAADRPASQIVRELMRDFIKRQQDERSYDVFVHQKVALSREQIARGEYFAAEDVEAEFAAKRTDLLRKANRENS